MRRWSSPRVLGALLSLMLVVASVATAFADPRDFYLTNYSDRDIAEIYVGLSNTGKWGGNLLSDGAVLPSGNTLPIAFENLTVGDCHFDIKVVTTGGGKGQLNQINLCETSTVTFR